MSTTRHELLHAFDLLLAPARFKDYGPNGLQVEGRTTVRRIVSGVTASRALIEAAIAAEAVRRMVIHRRLVTVLSMAAVAVTALLGALWSLIHPYGF